MTIPPLDSFINWINVNFASEGIVQDMPEKERKNAAFCESLLKNYSM